MSSRKAGSFEWQMLELSDGITTSNGNWYHITQAQINTYAPGLLKKYPLERIIREADAWVKSSDGLSLFLYFILAYIGINPWISAAAALSFFFLWFFNTSAFVNLASSSIVKTLNNDGFVYVLSAVLLLGIVFNAAIQSFGIYIGMDALLPGFILFFLFKVGLLRLLIKLIQSKREQVQVEMQDRILNMLLIRYGMKAGILTGEVSKMQDRLIEVANYHKTRKKDKKSK